MSKMCRVPFCGMKYRMKKENPNLSFHEFPADLTLRTKWLKVIRRKDFVPDDSDCVCSVHFQESDFKSGLKVVRLKPNAVPSLFPSFPKYLQPKRKRERRLIRRASPEEIASFKRSRKTNNIKSESPDHQSFGSTVDGASAKLSAFIDYDADLGEQISYEIIPINETLHKLLEYPNSDSNQCTMKDASTQASGMWEKIQELYKAIRKLKTELQKKTTEICNLNKLNQKLQVQLSNMKVQSRMQSCSPKADFCRKKIPQRNHTLANKNKQVRKEDLSSYLHPRVPRSLNPPKNKRVKNIQKVVFSGNNLNQVVPSRNDIEQDVVLCNNSANTSNSDQIPVNSKACDHITKDQILNAHEKRHEIVPDSGDVTESPGYTREPPRVIVVEEHASKECAQYQELQVLRSNKEYSSELVVVPESCIIESHCDELIIYSPDDNCNFLPEIHNSLPFCS